MASDASRSRDSFAPGVPDSGLSSKKKVGCTSNYSFLAEADPPQARCKEDAWAEAKKRKENTTNSSSCHVRAHARGWYKTAAYVHGKGSIIRKSIVTYVGADVSYRTGNGRAHGRKAQGSHIGNETLLRCTRKCYG